MGRATSRIHHSEIQPPSIFSHRIRGLGLARRVLSVDASAQEAQTCRRQQGNQFLPHAPSQAVTMPVASLGVTTSLVCFHRVADRLTKIGRLRSFHWLGVCLAGSPHLWETSRIHAREEGLSDVAQGEDSSEGCSTACSFRNRGVMAIATLRDCPRNVPFREGASGGLGMLCNRYEAGIGQCRGQTAICPVS